MKSKQILKEERGQSIVEFCLVIPIFFLLFLAVMQLGILLYQDVRANLTAWEVARAYLIEPGRAKQGQEFFKREGMEVTLHRFTKANEGEYLRVTASTPVLRLIPTEQLPKLAQGQVTVRVEPSP